MQRRGTGEERAHHNLCLLLLQVLPLVDHSSALRGLLVDFLFHLVRRQSPEERSARPTCGRPVGEMKGRGGRADSLGRLLDGLDGRFQADRREERGTGAGERDEGAKHDEVEVYVGGEMGRWG